MIKAFILLIALVTPADAQVRTIMEQKPATNNTIMVSVTNTRVGIGTASPGARLDVQGNILSTGTITGTDLIINRIIWPGGSIQVSSPAVSASGGGVSVSTFTVPLYSGGDVFVASGSLTAQSNINYIFQTTVTITGVQCHTLYSSSVGGTTFNVLISTGIGAAPQAAYRLLSSGVTVPAMAGNLISYSPWAAIDTAYGTPGKYPVVIALEVISTAATGNPAAEYGCDVRYWRRLD